MYLTKKGNNPALAPIYLWRGLRWIWRPELRPFVLIPILINLLLYGVALTLAYYFIADLINQFIPDWLIWLRWILWPVLFISFFMLGFFTFTLLANLIASPFYGSLSARVLRLHQGHIAEPEQVPPLRKVILAELSKITYQITRMLPLLVLLLIPGVNVIATVLLALMSAWLMALEYMSYPMENEGILFAEQKHLLRDIRLGALSFGGLVLMALTLPLFNIIVAPAAVIAATFYFHDIKA